MIKSSLVELLKTFSAQEFRELGEIVNSPFFNKNSKVTSLYDYIKKSYPNLDSANLEKEKAFKKLYPGEKFRDSTLRLVMFYLYDCAKQYIQIKRFKSDNVYSNVVLTRELIDRNLLKEAERAIKDNNDALDKKVMKDGDYFWNKYLNNSELLALRERLFFGRYEKYVTEKTYEELLKYLTDNFLLRTLSHYTVVLNINTMYKTQFSLGSYKNIIGAFDKEYFKDTPLLEMYYYASLMLENGTDESNFFALKNLLLKEEKNIGINTLLDLYINLENYCVRKSREGKIEFHHELFEIYKMELDKRVYIHDGFMPHYFYKSVAAEGLVVKDFEWVQFFLEKYREELHPDYRESAYYYCLTRLEMSRNKFEKALEYLSKVKTDEIYLKTETKLLFAYIYYETGIYDSLASLLDTMRHFFKNDKFLAEERKMFYWDFVKILNKLALQKQKNTAGDISAIKKSIESKEKLFMRMWLLEKANELENK